MKKLLITGKTGYIATSLYNALDNEYDITSIGRSDFDLSNKIDADKWFSDKHFDVVIHTAAMSGSRLYPDHVGMLDTNLKMFFNLLDNKNKYNKFITFGSGAEIHSPRSYYGMSKAIINRYIESENGFFNIRIYGVFDKNELDTRFIKANILKYIKKEPMTIHQNKFMDFFYMQDLVDLIKVYINDCGLNKTIDCRYEFSPSLLYITEKINMLDTYRVPIIVENELRGKDYCGSNFGLPITHIGLDEGIKRVFQELKAGIYLKR